MLTLDRSLCLIEFFCRQFFQYIKNHLASFACRSIDHRDRCIEFPRPLFRWNFRKKIANRKETHFEHRFNKFFFLIFVSPIFFPSFFSSRCGLKHMYSRCVASLGRCVSHVATRVDTPCPRHFYVTVIFAVSECQSRLV